MNDAAFELQLIDALVGPRKANDHRPVSVRIEQEILKLRRVTEKVETMLASLEAEAHRVPPISISWKEK